MEELYISTKLSFLESIKNNSVSSDIFRYLCNNKNKRKRYSKSFVQDIKLAPILRSYLMNIFRIFLPLNYLIDANLYNLKIE